MMDSLLSLPEGNPLGAVSITESYFVYDGMTMMARGKRGFDALLVLLADESEDTLIYLYAVTTEENFNVFHCDPLAKGATFTLLEQSKELWVVSFQFIADNQADLIINTAYSQSSVADLPEKWLPVRG